MVLEPSIWWEYELNYITWSPVFVSVATEHVLVDSDYCHCWPFGVTEGMECARTEVLLWSPVSHLPFFPRNLNRSKESHQSFVIFWIDAEDHWLHACQWILRGKKKQFRFNMINACQWHYSISNIPGWILRGILRRGNCFCWSNVQQNSGPQFWGENFLWLVGSITLMYSLGLGLGLGPGLGLGFGWGWASLGLGLGSSPLLSSPLLFFYDIHESSPFVSSSFSFSSLMLWLNCASSIKLLKWTHLHSYLHQIQLYTRTWTSVHQVLCMFLHSYTGWNCRAWALPW